MNDSVIKPKYLEKFMSGFSKSQAIKLETSGHFPQEEAAEKVTEAIHRFVVD